MAIEEQIRDEKLQYINREAAKILAFCKSTFHIPANIPHPTSRTSHIPNILCPKQKDYSDIIIFIYHSTVTRFSFFISSNFSNLTVTGNI